MGQLKSYIRPFYGYMLLTVMIKLFGAVVELLIPYLLQTMIDDVVPTGRRDWILLCGGGMILCAVVCVVSNIVANRMSAQSAGGITLRVRHDLFQRLEGLSARQLDELTISSAVSRLTSDTYNVNQLLARMQRLGIRGPILLLGGVIITMCMDMGLALVLIATLPIIALVVYFVTKTSVPLYTKEQGILDDVVRVVQENITGIRVIKALSKSDHERKRFNRVNDYLSDTDQKVGGITAITNPAATLVLNLGLTGVVLVGGLPGELGGGEARGDHCLHELFYHDSQRYVGGDQNFHHLVQRPGQRQAGGPGPGHAGGFDGAAWQKTGGEACLPGISARVLFLRRHRE